jgi:hypothetical protein
VIKEETTLATTSVDPQVSRSSSSSQTCSSTSIRALSPSIARIIRWLTQTLQEAKEQLYGDSLKTYCGISV